MTDIVCVPKVKGIVLISRGWGVVSVRLAVIYLRCRCGVVGGRVLKVSVR